MRGLSSLVWAFMVVTLLAGMGGLVYSRIYGTPRSFHGYVGVVRELDKQANSRLRDLGLRFAPRANSPEPTLDLDQPTDADFEFLESILETNDKKARVSAAAVLRDIGHPRAVPPLVRAIKGIEDIDVFFFECAITVVERQPPAQRAELLIPIWQDRGNLNDAMQEALRLKLRDAGALHPDFLAETAVSHPRAAIRRFALEELSKNPRAPAGVLAAALADPDETNRALALVAWKQRDASK